MMNDEQEPDSGTDDDDNEQRHDWPQVAVTAGVVVISSF